MNKNSVIKAMLLIITAIILGAFGAHSLEKILEAKQLASFKTGVTYQMYGGILLLIVGLNQEKLNLTSVVLLNLLFVSVCLFSISIYFLTVLSEVSFVKYLWPITPLGGLLMIVALSGILIKILKINK